MFGYIVPDKPELKVKEFELFRAYYCGLCKCIGMRCGQAARFALNYDSSFLGLLLSSFCDIPEVVKLEKCPAHPFVKRPVIGDSDAIGYAADMNIILAYYKALDNINDIRSIKSAGTAALFHGAFKRSSSRYDIKARKINEKLDELSKIENLGTGFIDKSAEPFAKLTEEIFAYEPICSTEDNERIMRWFGYNTGKWIYLLDAYDDIDDDIKNKNFNPILNQFCYNGEKITDFKDRVRENIRFTLIYTLSEVGKAYELMQLKKNKGIIENIVYGGMHKKTLQILDKRSCNDNEKPI